MPTIIKRNAVKHKVSFTMHIFILTQDIYKTRLRLFFLKHKYFCISSKVIRRGIYLISYYYQYFYVSSPTSHMQHTKGYARYSDIILDSKYLISTIELSATSPISLATNKVTRRGPHQKCFHVAITCIASISKNELLNNK